MEYHVITKAQYDYVLPAIRRYLGWKATPHGNEYYFFGTHEDWLDFLARAEGLKW